MYLDNLIENNNDDINMGLLNALKRLVMQQPDNSKCKIETWKQHISKSQTGRRPQTLIDKDMLRYLTSIGSKNTRIAKILNACINLVAHCVKVHVLIVFLKRS